MAIRGFCISISERLRSNQATTFAQWIGASNVMRNQKIGEYRELLADGKGSEIAQGYSHIKKLQGLEFLREVPVQLLRNAASAAFSDAEAARAGLRKFPKMKGRHKKRSVLLTCELFIIEPLGEHGSLLTIFDNATKKRQKLFSVKLPYIPEQLAKQFRISRQGAKFYLSGSYDDGVVNTSNEALLRSYAHLSDEELLCHVTGIDRGVVRPIQTSDGLTITYSPEEAESLRRQVKKKAHYQRILARKKRLNGNKNRHKCETAKQRKLAAKIAKTDAKMADVRKGFAHRASKQVVIAAKPIIGLEDLNLKGMTKRAKPKQEGRRFVKNNAHAKSGLNRSLLNVALGRLGDFIKYKAVDYGKATVEVWAAHSSMTHHVCGSRDTARPDQATLMCHHCGVVENADENAAKVVAQRTVTYIKESAFADQAKSRKAITRRKKKVADPPLVCELASV